MAGKEVKENHIKLMHERNRSNQIKDFKALFIKLRGRNRLASHTVE